MGENKNVAIFGGIFFWLYTVHINNEISWASSNTHIKSTYRINCTFYLMHTSTYLLAVYMVNAYASCQNKLIASH